MPNFVVNGQTYSDPNEMPPDVRKAYDQAMGALADKNQNGVPDILEGLKTPQSVAEQLPSLFQMASRQVIVDGKLYSSPEELSPEQREKYDQAMAKMSQVMGDANQNGVPDILENVLGKPGMTQAQTTTQVVTSTAQTFDEVPLENNSVGPVVTEVSSGTGKGMGTAGIVIAVLLIAVIVLAVMVVLPMLR
jgi:hypothetical protein